MQTTRNELKTQRVASETALRNHLASNLETLEPGLKLYSNNPKSIEFPCDIRGQRRVGSIDILALDCEDNIVVIECKMWGASPAAIGQLLGYMAWAHRYIRRADQIVRGILVACEVTRLLQLTIGFIKGFRIDVFVLSFDAPLRRLDP